MGILYLQGKVTFANEVHATQKAQTVCAFLIYQKPHEFEMQVVTEKSIPNKFTHSEGSGIARQNSGWIALRKQELIKESASVVKV